RSGIATDRLWARAAAGAAPDDPPAPALSRFSATAEREQPRSADRRLARLSRPPPPAAAGARMGDPLARNAHSAAARAGAVPSRFPYRQLPGGWNPADR